MGNYECGTSDIRDPFQSLVPIGDTCISFHLFQNFIFTTYTLHNNLESLYSLPI